MKDMVILVDQHDREIGVQEKMRVHQEGNLHRAFSIFIFNASGKMLLQKRADHKYHSGGLWTNACCSHPRPGEDTEQAAHRRLQEEMGFDCGLKELFHFIYKAELDQHLIEHELDHVFVGYYDGEIKHNPDEADSHQWLEISTLQRDVQQNPDCYTIWFRMALARVVDAVKLLA